jgi:PAB1-binding protein PBP1
MKQMKWLALALLLFSADARAASSISGAVVNRSTLNASVVITTGGTFQTVLNSIQGTSTQRQALTIENNNTTDSCYLFIGAGSASAGISMLLLPGGSYTRYWPYVPSDAFQATCANNSDTLYIDVQ